MLIQTRAQLQGLAERLHSEKVIGLDTEFASEGRYYAEPSTIQIATRDQAVLVDLLAVRDISPLHPILSSPEVTKILHAGRQDLEILYRLMGHPVRTVFDTQVVASLLGYGDQVSLRMLLKQVLGVEVEKDYTFTDWMRRPLSSGQVQYALNDVVHLLPLYDALREMLADKGRLQWAEEELKTLESTERYDQVDERQVYLSIKGAERLSRPQLGVLQELAAWRELTARQQNLPPAKIAMDPVLVELARRPRKSPKELAEIRGLHGGQISKYGKDMIAALARGRDSHPEPVRYEEALSAAMETTADFLSLCLRNLAREQSISPGVLGNRGQVRELVRSGSAADVPLLRGWRRKIAGDALLAALEGKVTLRVSGATREVEVCGL